MYLSIYNTRHFHLKFITKKKNTTPSITITDSMLCLFVFIQLTDSPIIRYVSKAFRQLVCKHARAKM